MYICLPPREVVAVDEHISEAFIIDKLSFLIHHYRSREILNFEGLVDIPDILSVVERDGIPRHILKVSLEATFIAIRQADEDDLFDFADRGREGIGVE